MKIHFFIESGLKMIQFKTKSRIFIKKIFIKLGSGQVLAVDGLPSPFEPRCDTRRLGLVAPGYEALWAVEWNNKQRCHQQQMMICTAQGHRAKAWQERYCCHAPIGGFWPIGMLQLLPAGFIHPLAANNLSIESRRCDQIFCAYSDEPG